MSEQQLVVFLIGSERYAFPILMVREIIPHQPMTHVPGMPSYMEGIIDLRGQILPVMDLRRRMGMAPVPAGEEARIVVAESGGTSAGCVVDGVAEVVRISPDAVVPVAESVGSQSDYLTGVVRVDDKLVLLIDPHRVLSRS